MRPIPTPDGRLGASSSAGECVLLTEAFVTLAAGTSGGGEVLLCGIGLVGIMLRCWVEVWFVEILAGSLSLHFVC